MSAAFDALARRAGDAERLCFTTAGDVDSGKSTLLGRLLHDCQAVYDDHVAALRRSRINRSPGEMDFALLLDGLRAEREQGITIDVAYRYFAGARRRFLIADNPGHEQYTRNMATGASHAEAALVVIDAAEGLRLQARRHIVLAHLLGVGAIAAVVNKLDRRDFSRAAFEALRAEAVEFAQRLGVRQFSVLPASAAQGDNVARRSPRLPWWDGPTVLEWLENAPLPDRAAARPLRLPVQHVLRPHAEFRGLAGTVASGRLRVGQAVTVLPAGIEARVERIVGFAGDLAEAAAPAAVTVTLDRDLDVGRGDLLADAAAPAAVSAAFAARVAWFGEQPLRAGARLLIKHTTRIVRARAVRVRHRLDLAGLESQPAEALALNEIGEVEWAAAAPLTCDPYQDDRATGALLLIDPLANTTVGLGMITAVSNPRVEAAGAHLERWRLLGQRPVLVWLRGDQAPAEAVERHLARAGIFTVLLSAARWQAAPEIAASLAASGAVVLVTGPAPAPPPAPAGLEWFAPGEAAAPAIAKAIQAQAERI